MLTNQEIILNDYPFLSGGGEMGRLMRAKDWSSTTVGQPGSWPQSLRTTLGILLNSKFPMFLFWGKDHVCFYNDAYRPSLGENGKHPGSLGKPGKEVWPEIWSDIFPLITQVMAGGEATWAEDQLLPIYRNGHLEDVYWTFSYSPVMDESETIAGVFVTCTETTEKIKNYKSLKENLEELHFTIESAELGTWDYNPSSNKFTANGRLKKWFGLLEEDEVELSTATRVIADKDRDRVEAAIKKALDYHSGGLYDVEYTVINPVSNEAIVVSVKGKATFNEDKVAYRFNGTMQDVTDKVTARIQLEENEYRFRTLIEESPIATGLYTGRELKIQYANDVLIRILGKTTAILAKPLAEAVPELKGQSFLAILDEVFTTGKEYTGTEEPAQLMIDGSLQTFYFDFSYKPLKNPDGTVFGIQHNAIDVTKRVKASKALKESEKKFRDTVQQAPLGITILSGSDHIVSMANNVYLEIVDRKENTFIEKPLFESMPEVQTAVAPILQDVLKTGEPYYGVEFPVHLHRGGEDELTYFNFVYHPLKEEDGSVKDIIVVASDVTASVKAKHTLAESEKQFRNMVMQSPIPMTIFRGREYIIETANKALIENIWRKNEADVMGRPVLEVFPELKDQKYPDLLKAVLEKGIVHRENESIAWVQGDDGLRKFYLDYEYRPFFESDGTVSGVIVTVNDVTEKVEARLKVEQSEQRLNLVIDATELGTWEWNIQSDDMKYNDRFAKIFGFEATSDLRHDQLLKRLHPDDLPARKLAFERAYQNGMLNYESRIVWSNGIQRWMQVKGKVFKNNHGEPIFLIGTARDTTDEKNHQQELEDRERKFRVLADAMPQLVWTANAYGDINYFNQSFYNFSGLEETLLMKNGWLQLVHPEDREESTQAWKDSIDNGNDFIIEHRFLNAAGEYRWQLSRAIPQKDVLENIRMWVGTSTDIQQIKELDEQKDLFIGMASHELKTPVTTVKGYVQLLQDMYADAGDDFLKHSFERMHKQMITLTDLISDLLDLSKIKSGSLYFNREDFDLLELINEIISNTRDVNPGYTIEFNHDHKILVHADRNRLAQVLINFLTNAIKYSPDSKLIKAAVAITDNHVTVSVEDKGIGIVKTDQEKIFQRFYRVEGKNEKTFPGFGIGLFISAEIIKKHAGTIGVTSEQGVGSVFYFTLPLVKS